MLDKPFLASRGFRIVSAAALGIALAALGGKAFSGQDKYTLRVPNGLAFSDFRGCENWQVVAVSQTDDLLKVIVANPTMINAYGSACLATASLFPTAPRLQKSSGNRKRARKPLFLSGYLTPYKTFSSLRRTARNFRTRRDGHTPRLTTIPHRTRSSPIRRRRHLWLLVPFESSSQGLHFHGVRQEVRREIKSFE
jgi:hypothetical protein